MAESSEEERQRLILEASRFVEALREWSASQEPDWDPLHAVVVHERCNGFMWMYSVAWRDRLLEVHKHGITRRSSHLDHDGRAYVYRGNSYEEVPVVEAIDRVFVGIEAMEATRETPYTEEYVREKRRRARAVG